MFFCNKIIFLLKKYITYYFQILAIAVGFYAVANDQDEFAALQKKLQTTFSNLNVVDFRPSPISNLFELNLGNKIIYYYPEKELLLFGEIFNKEGISLTGESLARQSESTLKQTAFSSGLILGPAKGVEIIEFSDPDCPYSQRADEFFRDLSSQYQFTRKLFFDLRAHPHARKKAIHVLCSKDPDKALSQLFSGDTVEFLSCISAEKTLKQQAMAAEKLGISGTPSFLIAGKIMTGFKPEELMDFLVEQKGKEDGSYKK